ncbi:MAG: NAD-dependent epimerase/dehydratase family protein [Aeromicrobium sp.]|nr:MAG: NAD-dependent epimerase/dehydratase family protein [Aeromicrobium sp.]
MVKVIVVGASGFVGSHVCEALEARGATVLRIAAPRLPSMGAEVAESYLESLHDDAVLTEEWRGAVALVNAAGNPDASSRRETELCSANGVLPGLLGRRAAEAAISRYVHVSSAVVQGRTTMLDETVMYDAFSPYSRSKVLGEQLAEKYGPSQTVSYRPPSVHDASRRVTRLIARVAVSRFSTVSAPGTQHSPQALIQNVAAAIAELALCSQTPPPIVMHPWEGVTCESLLVMLGGKPPVRIPRQLAVQTCAILRFVGRYVPNVAANARRVEMIWLGQDQAQSWLSTAGFKLPVGTAGWEVLREQLADHV